MFEQDSEQTVIGFIAMAVVGTIGYFWKRNGQRIEDAHHKIGELEKRVIQCTAEMSAKHDRTDEKIEELKSTQEKGLMSIHSRLDTFIGEGGTPRRRRGDE